MALNECRRLLQELNQKHCQIFSPAKNIYHQNPDRLDKSSIDQPYSVTKLLTVALQHPDIVQIEYNGKGKCSGTKIEKKFDVPIGFPQRIGYYPLPTCSVIKFKLDPANQSQYYCQGKPTVLTRYTLSQDYTFQNVPGKVFHQFTNSCLPNHAHCFYDMQNTALNGNRRNPIKIFQYCNFPNCTCQAQQPPPPNQPPQTNPLQTNPLQTNPLQTNPLQTSPLQTNPLQTQYLLQVGMGDKPKTKEVPKVGMGDKPKAKEVPNVGMRDKPKKNEVPKVGMGEIPMVSFEQPPQRNIKFEQDRKRCSTDTDGKNPHENKRVHRDACVSDLVWPICKIDNTEYSKRFNIQILEAMTIFHQGMARLMA